MYDENRVKEHIQVGFGKLYTSEMSMSFVNSPVSSFSCYFFLDEEKDWIGRAVLEEEIKYRLWNLKPFKALGPDGLHVTFFQHYWQVVRSSVCQEVKNIFLMGVVPDYLNRTLITLIPRCQNPKTLSNFRPISLSNSVYKIVSKIIVGRIKPMLNRLIAPVQSAYVPGRKSVDNVLIA